MREAGTNKKCKDRLDKAEDITEEVLTATKAVVSDESQKVLAPKKGWLYSIQSVAGSLQAICGESEATTRNLATRHAKVSKKDLEVHIMSNDLSILQNKRKLASKISQSNSLKEPSFKLAMYLPSVTRSYVMLLSETD